MAAWVVAAREVEKGVGATAVVEVADREGVTADWLVEGWWAATVVGEMEEEVMVGVASSHRLERVARVGVAMAVGGKVEVEMEEEMVEAAREVATAAGPWEGTVAGRMGAAAKVEEVGQVVAAMAGELTEAAVVALVGAERARGEEVTARGEEVGAYGECAYGECAGGAGDVDDACDTPACGREHAQLA